MNDDESCKNFPICGFSKIKDLETLVIIRSSDSLAAAQVYLLSHSILYHDSVGRHPLNKFSGVSLFIEISDILPQYSSQVQVSNTNSLPLTGDHPT